MINKYIETERERDKRHLEERLNATLYIHSISSDSQKLTLIPIIEEYDNRYFRLTKEHYKKAQDILNNNSSTFVNFGGSTLREVRLT